MSICFSVFFSIFSVIIQIDVKCLGAANNEDTHGVNKVLNAFPQWQVDWRRHIYRYRALRMEFSPAYSPETLNRPDRRQWKVRVLAMEERVQCSMSRHPVQVAEQKEVLRLQ